MPYLITTSQPVTKPIIGGTYLCPMSRRAVGTLDEAREITWENVVDAGADLNIDRTPFRAAVELSGSGGTVGPLPDGTVVEVESFEWSQLARSCSPPLPIQGAPGDSWTDAEKTQIVDTYNAAQED